MMINNYTVYEQKTTRPHRRQFYRSNRVHKVRKKTQLQKPQRTRTLQSLL